MPQLIEHNKKSLKVWCAGCSTGEEPYSIAIMLRCAIPCIEDWDISILATDVNPNFLNKARKGIYSKWSFRGQSESFIDNFFKKIEGNKYQISREIREMVTFKSLNLIKEEYPLVEKGTSEIDVILCRNVMIYFSNEGVNTVVDKFSNSLVKGGLFMVSSVEVPNIKKIVLKPVMHHGNTFFIKDGDRIHSSFIKENRIKYSKPKRIKNIASSYDRACAKVKVDVAKKSANLVEMRLFEDDFVEKGENDEVKLKEALAFYESGLLDKAEGVLERIHVDSKEDVLLLLAKIKADKGRLVDAEEIYLKVIEINRINFDAHFLLSTVQSEQGKLIEARKSLKNSLFLNPDFALGYFMLGNIAKQIGEEVECEKHFRSALKILDNVNPDRILEKSDGLTAARLTNIIKTIG